jgi:sRNA-binding regulator protein Hfq
MANHSVLPTPEGDDARLAGPPSSHAHVSSVPPSGPRKLVRPSLPARVLNGRSFSRRESSPLLAHQELAEHAALASAAHSSHAEAFYFQKQMQTQTLMVFVLEDGERVEGYIEWYDRNAIKVRHGGRTLIYKSCIKYLHKAGENHR